MKNRLKLLTASSVFLALTVAVIAASQDSPAQKGGRAGAPAAVNPAAVNAKRPFAPAGGGDTCGTAAPIGSLPFNDSGNTTGAADDVTSLPGGCGTGYTQVQGPDLIYSITVGAGNSLNITVNPTAAWDPKIYLLSTCGDNTSCIVGADAAGASGSETITPSGLTPGTYFLYIDSFYSAAGNPTLAQGPYTLSVTGSLGGVPATNTPTLTNTPTSTPTVTNTSVVPTNTPTTTPTVTATSVVPTATPTATATSIVPTATPTVTSTTVPSSPTATVTISGGGPGNGPSSPIPTLSTWMLAFFAVGLAAAALFMTRRS